MATVGDIRAAIQGRLDAMPEEKPDKCVVCEVRPVADGNSPYGKGVAKLGLCLSCYKVKKIRTDRRRVLGLTIRGEKGVQKRHDSDLGPTLREAIRGLVRREIAEAFTEIAEEIRNA